MRHIFRAFLFTCVKKVMQEGCLYEQINNPLNPQTINKIRQKDKIIIKM